MENSKKELEFKITGLSDANKQIKGLNDQLAKLKADGKEGTEEYAKLVEQINEVTAAIKSVKNEVKAASNDPREALSAIKTQLYELKAAGKDNTEEYAELVEKAKELDAAIKEVNAELKNTDDAANKATEDTIDGFKGALDVVKGGVGVFQAIQSSVALFGVENEKVEETLKKLVATQNLLNSIDAIRSSYLSKNSGLYKLLTKDILTYTTTTKAATVAQKALNVALKASGIGLIITIVASLVSKIDELITRSSVLNKAISEIEAVISGLGSAILNWVVNPIETLLTVLSDIKNGEFKKALDDIGSGINKQFKGTVDAFKEAYKQSKEFNKNQLEYQIEYLEKLKETKTDFREQYKLQKQIFDLKEKLINALKNEEERTQKLKLLALDRVKAAKEFNNEMLKSQIEYIDKLKASETDLNKQSDLLNESYRKKIEYIKKTVTDTAEKAKQINLANIEYEKEVGELEEKRLDNKLNYLKASKELEPSLEKQRELQNQIFEVEQQKINLITDETERTQAQLLLEKEKAKYAKELSKEQLEKEIGYKAQLKDTTTNIDEQYKLQQQIFDLREQQINLIEDEEERTRQLALLEEDRKNAEEAYLKAKKDEIIKAAVNIASTSRDAVSSVFEGMSSIIQENIDRIQDAIEDVTKDIERSERKVEKYQNKLQNYYTKLADSVGEDRREVVSAIKETEMAIEEQYALQEQLDAEKQAKEKEMRAEEYKQKKINLANSLIQSIVNTAVGITQVIAQAGVAAPVLAAIIGAMGAVQTALIASQMGKLKMANGGLLKGASHREGGIPVGNTGIEVEGGEYVVNKRATSKYLPILEQINSYGKSTTKFSRGGELNLPNSDSFETAELLLSNINFNPVVSVVDINKASNRLANVKVMSR